jgi:hypothetical protein
MDRRLEVLLRRLEVLLLDDVVALENGRGPAVRWPERRATTDSGRPLRPDRS